MSPPALRVAEVFRQHWADYLQNRHVPARHLKVVKHLTQCRTAALGGHLYRCEHCGHQLALYNSCRDRHCPTCQTLARERRLEQRRAELLPVRYFHAVFTLPHSLNPLIHANRRVLLNELFAAVNWVLQSFAADPRWRLRGRLGWIAVLHTWSQTLIDHVHLHCIIPGGVWRHNERRWVHARRKFLLRKDSLAKAFRRRCLQRLQQLRDQGKLRFVGLAAELIEDNACSSLMNQLQHRPWIVYPKPAFAGPTQVLDYLGRYTHRVAIGDHRIRAVANNTVTFSYRDRQDHNALKEMNLQASEFIRRFLLHVLPPGFHKIRFFGWMARNVKASCLERIRRALDAHAAPVPRGETPLQRTLRLLRERFLRCAECGAGLLAPIALLARAPP